MTKYVGVCHSCFWTGDRVDDQEVAESQALSHHKATDHSTGIRRVADARNDPGADADVDDSSSWATEGAES